MLCVRLQKESRRCTETPLGLGTSDGRMSVKCDAQLRRSATQDGWCLCCVEGGYVFMVKQRQNERLFLSIQLQRRQRDIVIVVSDGFWVIIK